MSPMTKVLMPLTTPPISPLPEDTRPEPKFLAKFTAAAYQSSQGMLSSRSVRVCSSSGRYAARASSCSRSRSRAEGIWRTMVITASAMPGPITLLASVKTPRTASNVSTRARGRRNFAPRRLYGYRCRSMARIGTFRTKASAPPRRKGLRMPSSQRKAAAAVPRF